MIRKCLHQHTSRYMLYHLLFLLEHKYAPPVMILDMFVALRWGASGHHVVALDKGVVLIALHARKGVVHMAVACLVRSHIQYEISHASILQPDSTSQESALQLHPCPRVGSMGSHDCILSKQQQPESISGHWAARLLIMQQARACEAPAGYDSQHHLTYFQSATRHAEQHGAKMA